MHAHRLWIRLWITLGHPEENSNRPGGNARVTPPGSSAAHSYPYRPIAAGHSQCAQPQRGLAARIVVIPGIHRPYDDYQFCNDKQIKTKVGTVPGRACDETPDQIRRGDGEDRP